jgi:hypothetical protein
LITRSNATGSSLRASENIWQKEDKEDEVVLEEEKE